MQENENIVENLRHVFARNTRRERRKAAFTALLMIGGLIALAWSWARC